MLLCLWEKQLKRRHAEEIRKEVVFPLNLFACPVDRGLKSKAACLCPALKFPSLGVWRELRRGDFSSLASFFCVSSSSSNDGKLVFHLQNA